MSWLKYIFDIGKVERYCGNDHYENTCQICPKKGDSEPQAKSDCSDKGDKSDCEWNDDLKSCQLEGNT